MKLKESAKAALSGLPDTTIGRGFALLDELNEGSFTARFENEDGLTTVVLELSDDGSRLACTCGAIECEHQAALLAALIGDDVPASTEHSRDRAPQHQVEGVAPDSQATPVTTELADAIDGLVSAICSHGLTAESEARDVALSEVIKLLAGQDLPDLKRAVATVRRTITTSSPDPSIAWEALSRLTRLALDLRSTKRSSDTVRGRLHSRQGRTEHREEVRLLEVARFTQRTPFGDRRDAFFFLDLDEDVLFRELAASLPGASPTSLSEGPFAKRLLGNLVSIEKGPPPQRIRMLQYATVGFASDEDLDHLLSCCETEVEALYEIVRRTISDGLDAAEKVVMFAPDQVIPSPSGVVFCDESGDLLPLARGRSPSLCATVDLLNRQGKILAIVGQLVLGPQFVSILPLTALVELPAGRSLRRLS